ncbi:MAG: hypothetical protein ABR555_11565 [Pyrinomonadaceae bacterium]
MSEKSATYELRQPANFEPVFLPSVFVDIHDGTIEFILAVFLFGATRSPMVRSSSASEVFIN